jgi:hypothetical protein
MSTSEFDAAIDKLAGETSLQDPDRLTALLSANTHVTPTQLRRLWEISVFQSAVADVQRASGDETFLLRERQRGWTRGAEALRTALAETMAGDTVDAALTTYCEETRAVQAYAPFALRVRHLEGLLRRQRSLIGFHWADEQNAYRAREREFSERLCAPEGSHGDRLTAANRLLEEIGRYEAVYLPKLDAIAAEAAEAFSECERFVALFSRQHHPEVHRWHNLTRDLLTARRAAITHIRHRLQFDALFPKDVIEGHVKEVVVDGKATPVLSEAATVRFKQFVEEEKSLVAQSVQKEQETEAERLSLQQTLREEEKPTLKPPEPEGPPHPSPHQPSHPIEMKAWYRLAKLCWWGVFAIWSAFSLLVSVAWPQFLIAGLAGVVVLYAIKAGVFYVVLGRTTLHERAGSGFVDLEMFEKEMFELGENGSIEDSGNVNEEFQQAIREFRTRYGQRVPAEVIRTFVRNRLSSLQRAKKRVLSDADRQGKTISVESLRASVMGAQPSGVDRNEYLLSCERSLLRLEVKHGPAIPVSAVAEVADALSETGSAGT